MLRFIVEKSNGWPHFVGKAFPHFFVFTLQEDEMVQAAFTKVPFANLQKSFQAPVRPPVSNQ